MYKLIADASKHNESNSMYINEQGQIVFEKLSSSYYVGQLYVNINGNNNNRISSGRLNVPDIPDLLMHHSMSFEKNKLIMIYDILYNIIGTPDMSLTYDPQCYHYSPGSISTRIEPPHYDDICKDSLMVGQIPVELTGFHWGVRVWEDSHNRYTEPLSMCRCDSYKYLCVVLYADFII